MNTLKTIRVLLACAGLLALVMPTASEAQSGMTYEEYKVKLAQYENRKTGANRDILACREENEKLSAEIVDLDGQIAALDQEIYQLLGATESEVSEFFGSLDQSEAQLMGLMSLSDSDLFDKREEVDRIGDLLKSWKESKIALLPDAANKLRNIEQLLERLNTRMPAKRIRNYTVMRNDSLWRIAKKPEIYDNAYLWPRIYLENRGLIKDPDLIYPNWVLKVPFGVDRGQHLVLQGHTLSTIAAKVYKDASKWHQLYDANRTQILDPNLVFPAQVLEVPAN